MPEIDQIQNTGSTSELLVYIIEDFLTERVYLIQATFKLFTS